MTQFSIIRKLKIRNFFAGYTLIETLISVAIFAILGVAIASFVFIYVRHSEVLLKQKIETEVQNYHWRSLADLESSIRQSKQVKNNLTIDGAYYETSSTTLVLELYSLDSSQNILESYSDYIIYYLDASDSHKLFKRASISASSIRPNIWSYINSNVDWLRFSYNNANFASSTKIGIALKSKKQFGNVIKIASTTLEVALR